MFSKWLTEDAWHENLFAEVILKKLCERHLTSLCHANVQCINLRIEIIFSQNLRILMVKTDVKDKFSHFFGCLYGGDAKDSGTSACACGLFSSATTSCNSKNRNRQSPMHWFTKSRCECTFKL